MSKKIILEALRWMFVLILIYTGLSKFFGYSSFKTTLTQSPLLRGFPPGIAWTIPLAEIVVALLLVTTRWRLIGLYSFCCLMLIFTLYIVALTQFTYYIPCGCSGFIETLPPSVHILLNSVLTILAIVCISVQKKETNEHLYKILVKEIPG